MNLTINLLSDPQIKGGVISTITMLVTMTLKSLCKKDANFKYTRSDLAIGFNLIAGAMVIQVKSICDILRTNKEKNEVEFIFNDS